MEEEGITTVEIITTTFHIDANTTVRSKYKALYLARHVHIAIVLPSCSAITYHSMQKSSVQKPWHYGYFD